MNVAPACSQALLLVLYERTVGIRYGYGRKPYSLDEDSADLVKQGFLDCSGYSRWMVARTSYQRFIMPDGSEEQHTWAQQQLSSVPYEEAWHDTAGTIFICFLPPVPGDAGHVWLLHKGMTIECHGGKGVDRRQPDSPIRNGSTTLAAACNGCYSLPTAP